MSNVSVMDAIRAHHAEMESQLRARVAQVRGQARDGAPDEARDELVRWCRQELLPHAVAEERTLYHAGAGLATTRLLVTAMVTEHRVVEGAIDALAGATGALPIVAAAAVVEALFSVHLGKENDLLLPALDGAGLDLVVSLAGMHEIVGQHHHAAGR